jgi:molecular chaperone DnaK
VDVAAHSLGIKTRDNIFLEGGLRGFARPDFFSTIIRRNSQVPVTRSEVYHTIVDDQERVAIEVYQGESARCSENTLIGHFPFELRPAPQGSPVVVEFRYDLDGIIRVVVHQKGTDNRQEVTLSTRTRGQAEAGAAGPVENYILRKARSLAASPPSPLNPLDTALRERLAAAASAYEEVLADPAADPEDVDSAEEELLELLDEAEGARVEP